MCSVYRNTSRSCIPLNWHCVSYITTNFSFSFCTNVKLYLIQIKVLIIDLWKLTETYFDNIAIRNNLTVETLFIAGIVVNFIFFYSKNKVLSRIYIVCSVLAALVDKTLSMFIDEWRQCNKVASLCKSTSKNRGNVG